MRIKNKIYLQGVYLKAGYKIPERLKYIQFKDTLYTNLSFSELDRVSKTDKWLYICNHHRIHILQAETFKFKWWGFYWNYFKWFIKALWHLKSIKAAYKCNPFELEAFKFQFDLSYSKSNWEMYTPDNIFKSETGQ